MLRQILPFLTIGWIKCVGSNSTSLTEITWGVSQGSPMIPTLFSIFMDVLAERIESNSECAENSGIILFANDAQLTAKSQLALEQNLDTAFTWATETEMTWNDWKCFPIQPENDQVFLKMGTEPIQVVESETNLGVTITREDITYMLLRERTQKTYVRLEIQKRIGLNAKGFGPRMSRSMYFTFIRPCSNNFSP